MHEPFAKFSFGVQVGNFLGFMQTRKDIEANPNKFQTFITMRSPTTVKEVQHLTSRLSTISRFLSCACDKAFLFLTALKKRYIFKWISECKDSFTKVKCFLTSSPILTRPREDSSILLYLSIIDHVMSSVLI